MYLYKIQGTLEKNIFGTQQSVWYRKTFIRRTFQNAGNQLESLKEQAEKQASQEEIIQKYRSITQLTRPIICELIDQIQVGKKDPETKQIPIKIIWNI